MPRWVKVFLVVAAVVAVAVIASLIAGVDHGPGLHRPADDHVPAEHGP